MATQKVNVPMLGLFLGIIAAVAAGLLSGVHAMTEPQIMANKKAAVNAAMAQVLPEHDNDPTQEVITLNAPIGWPVTFYTARKNGEIVGYAGVTDNPDEGYSGTISLMVGLEPDGRIRQIISENKTNSAVVVTAQSETPGLGTSVTDRKQQKTIFDLIKGAQERAGLVVNPYLDWYAGKQAGKTGWPIKKEGPAVNAKTGATITSRAVSSAIYAISKTAVDQLETLEKGTGK